MTCTAILREKIITHLLRSSSVSKGDVPPTEYMHIGLFTVAPAADGTGGTELSSGGGSEYLRQQCGIGDSYWSEPDAAGQSHNLIEIAFHDDPLPTDWGEIVAIMIFSAQGNPYFWTALDNPKTYLTGERGPVFPAGSITITIT